MSSRFRSPEDLARFEARLRAGAAALRRAPTPDLHGRILAAVRATPQDEPRDFQRLGTLVAVAASLLTLLAAGWLAGVTPRPEPRARQIAAYSRELLGAGTRVLKLPGEAEGNLRLEARRLLLDTTRAAAGVVRGLPSPLRFELKLEQM